MFTYIPMPVIASILMTSAFRLVPIKVMKQLINEDLPEFFILVFTTAVCIFGDGALGLLAGGFMALMRNAANNNSGQISFQEDGDVLVASITGQLTYITALDAEIKITDKAKQA
jgi:MFS superfamily sulfate permease-like transporter